MARLRGTTGTPQPSLLSSLRCPVVSFDAGPASSSWHLRRGAIPWLLPLRPCARKPAHSGLPGRLLRGRAVPAFAARWCEFEFRKSSRSPLVQNPHQRNNLFPRGMSFKPMSRRSRSLPSRIMFGASCRARVMSCRCQALSPCGKRDFELQFLMRTNPASFDFWVSHQMGMPNRF